MRGPLYTRDTGDDLYIGSTDTLDIYASTLIGVDPDARSNVTFVLRDGDATDAEGDPNEGVDYWCIEPGDTALAARLLAVLHHPNAGSRSDALRALADEIGASA